jgi:heavy metal sensor kinase
MNLLGRRLRARTRLTLWYVVLLAGILLLVGDATLWSVGRTLAGGEDALLQSRSAGLRAKLETDKGRLKFGGDDNETGVAELTAGLDLARVWDSNRNVVFERAWSETASIGRGPLEQALSGGPVSDQERTAGEASFRLFAEPIVDHGRIVGVVEVGRSSAELEQTVARLGLIGLVGLAAALLLAWVGGSLLAKRALAPVDRIRRAAEQLSTDDLSSRLALALPDDELGRLATAFDAMLDRLDHGFQRQRRFTADAAHELRTPLAIMRSEVDVALANPRSPDDYRLVLASVREELERLTRLTESLLMLARADEQQSQPLAPVDLEELVAEVSARSTSRVHEHGLRLGVELAVVGPVINGDATWLTQLLVNLLDNAMRHTLPGGSITVTLRPVHGGIELAVADSGEGIPPEHLERIFERFYRADRARSRASGGTGLGLAICDWIARVHRGHLQVASQPGQGTTVTLWLPAAPAGPRSASSAPRPVVEVR